MKILVQTNKRQQHQLEHEFKKLEESGFEIIPFGYYLSEDSKAIIFTGLDDFDTSTPFVLRANIEVLRLLKVEKIQSNIDLSNAIDYNHKSFNTMYIPSCEAFLNLSPQKHAFIKLKVVLNRRSDSNLFIKPIDDLKLFAGTYIPACVTLLEVLEEKKDRIVFSPEELEKEVLVSNNCQRIVEEVRCYVVNRKVVTMSRYRYQDKYNVTPPPEVLSEQYLMYAQRVIDKIYSPCDNFTIDLCEIGNNTLRVVEYNCLTSSGLYECDTVKLFTALKEYYYG